MARESLLHDRAFRLLWLGQSISVLGDQCYLIALPWLVLQVSGDAGTMASVLATAAVPRAVLMLVGGVLSDRHSPRLVMLASNAARMAVVGTLAALVLTSRVDLAAIYACALLFGIADALFFPAEASLLPRLIPVDALPRGNALIVGTARIGALLGPLLAGALIGSAGRAGAASAGLDGIGLALALDAVTFLVSIATLARIPERGGAAEPGETRALPSILQGMRHLRSDPALRVLIPFFSVMSFIAAGVMGIAVPVLAERRFDDVMAFGAMVSASGLGALLGTLAVGMLPPPPRERVPAVAMLAFALFGCGILLLADARALPTAVAALVGAGCCGAYGELHMIAWIQARAPRRYLGRVMSVLMFFTMGLSPISMAVFGALLQRPAAPVLGLCGALYVGLALTSLGWRSVRRAAATPASA